MAGGFVVVVFAAVVVAALTVGDKGVSLIGLTELSGQFELGNT